MAFGIDIKGMTAKLEERFQALLTELQGMHATLRAVLSTLDVIRENSRSPGGTDDSS